MGRKFWGINLDTEGGFLELEDFVFEVVRAVLVGVGILRVNLMGRGSFVEVLVKILHIIRAVTQLLHFESRLKARLNLTHRSVGLSLGQRWLGHGGKVYLMQWQYHDIVRSALRHHSHIFAELDLWPAILPHRP